MERVTDEIIKPKKRIFGKIFLLIFIIGLIIFIIGLKNFLAIRNIVVVISSQDEAQNKITKEDVLKLSNLNVGDKLYKELRSKISERIEQNPYVKEAKIDRNISGELKITVTRKKCRIFSKLFWRIYIY